MPRPRKERRVCAMPNYTRFAPENERRIGPINMTVDEYETIRLIDLEGCTQEQCAAQMDISRTTVQGIYDSARKKLAQSLVNGKVLLIEGGEYRLCDGQGHGCGGAGCRRHRCGRHFENMENETEDTHENHDSHE